MVGNGGSNGFIRYDVMQVPVGKYGFAVGSTASRSSYARTSHRSLIRYLAPSPSLEQRP